jgi:hypothetical protein
MSAENKTPGRGLAMVVYGPPGVGKTSFAAHFPDVGFIHDDQETGIITLKEFGQCPADVPIIAEAEKWEPLLSTLDSVALDSRIKTLAIDSLTGIERICFANHCQLYFNGDWTKEGFFAFQQGPANAAKNDWPQFLKKLNNLVSMGINVILLAHSQTKNKPNPSGHDFLAYQPYMHKETWATISKWAQAVLFYNNEFSVDKRGPKVKAREGSERRIFNTQQTAACEAKNWFGLPPVIPAGNNGKEAFNAFWKAYNAARNAA